MHMKRLIAALALTAVLGGCGNALAPAPKAPEPVAHDNARLNYALGLEYQAEGRHELAREHFLLALAISRDEEFKNQVAEELEAADKALRSLR